MSPERREQLVLSLVVVAVVIVPFSNRAVYMDEHVFLRLAQSALANPAFPQDIPCLYFGTWFQNAADHTHSVFGEYHLAALYGIFGHFSEIPFRLLFATPYVVFAVLGFHGLARRWTTSPFLLTLLFVFTPPFFVMAPTLMMDVPSVGCLLFGLNQFFKGRVWIASLFFTAAVGCGYTACIPLGSLALWLIYNRRDTRELAACAVPIVCLAVWLTAMTIHFGGFPLAGTVAYALSTSKPAHTFVASLSFMGGLAMFPWSFLSSGQSNKPLAVVIGVIGAIVVFLLVPTLSVVNRVLFATMVGSDIAMLVILALSLRGRIAERNVTGEMVLLIWFPAAWLFFVLVADMMTARYLVLLLPPLLLLLFREASSRALLRILVPTAALAIILAISDYRFVDSYRVWARENVPALQARGRVWSATESGLRFYLEQTGIDGLDKTDVRPATSDRIVQHGGLFRYGLSAALSSRLADVKSFQLDDPLPIRTFNMAAGAGFHDSRIGLVPFTFSTIPTDRIEVAEVR